MEPKKNYFLFQSTLNVGGTHKLPYLLNGKRATCLFTPFIGLILLR